MAETPSQISCLLIPVREKYLLLPNASVAEIVDYQTPEKAAGTPNWFLGYVRWRGLRLPVISYDCANDPDNEFTPPAQARIAVTNTIGPQHSSLPFMAFVTAGLPRLMKVNKEEITERDEAPLGPADQIAVKVSGEDAFVPKMEHLESLAAEAVTRF